VGLLMPVVLCAALALGAAAELELRRGRARRSEAVLALAALAQLVLTLPQAREWQRAPDAPRVRAELLARYLPAGALLFAGPLTNHLRFYCPAVEVLSLPELLHDAHARERAADPIEVVRAAVRAAGRRCVLSSDGAQFLRESAVDPARLGLSVGNAFLVPEDPKLALFPLSDGLPEAPR
jgi:hypothetical protein